MQVTTYSLTDAPISLKLLMLICWYVGQALKGGSGSHNSRLMPILNNHVHVQSASSFGSMPSRFMVGIDLSIVGLWA